MSRFRITYAQNQEDIILSGFFENIKKGFYVDVGANHPEVLSVTKNFYDDGWHGINIEPNKQLYELVVQARPKDINLNIGVADAKGELTFREYMDGNGLSTFSKETQTKYEDQSSVYRKNTLRHKDYKVKVMTLKEIFEKHKPPVINFMNIDVEGFEYQVIQGNDWDKYRPQVLCIEANNIDKDWRPLLKKAKYDFVFFDGLNNYYVAQEHSKMARNFSYANTVLLGKPVIPARLQKNLNELEIQLRALGDKLNRQELIEAGLRTEIHNLYLQQAANQRLRKVAKQFVASLNAMILVHIEKLNNPKLKKQEPILLTGNLTKADLLMRIKQYDLERYYGAKTTHPISYRLIHSSYSGLYAAGKTTTRKFARTLSRAKND